MAKNKGKGKGSSKGKGNSKNKGKGSSKGKGKNKGKSTTKKTLVQTVRDRYNNYNKQEDKIIDTKAKQDVASSNAGYDSNAKSAYVNNVLNNRNLNDSLVRGGITGGASETSMVNANNNYANQQTGIANARSGAETKIKAQAVQDKMAYKLANQQNEETAENNARTFTATQKQQSYENKVAASTRKENRYAATIGRFDTEKKANSAIKKNNSIIKHSKNKGKRNSAKMRNQYIGAQLAVVRTNNKKNAK